MAEIKIEKRSPKWPWILAAVAAVVAILLLIDFDGDDQYDDDELTQTEQDMIMSDGEQELIEDDVNPYADDIQPSASVVTVFEATPTSVTTFLNTVDGDIKGRMGLDHDFTHSALVQLANAVQATADKYDYDIKADIDAVKEYAVDITEDPYADDHADKIRKAADKLTHAMEGLASAKMPNAEAEVKEMREAQMKIKPGVLTLNQKEHVKGFFKESADVVRMMN